MANQIVHTLRASGGDYSTFAAWEAAQQRNLVAADEVAVLECYNDWPSGLSEPSFSLSGWSTDATRNVIIRAAVGEGHNGVPKTGFYFTNSSSWTTCFNVNGVNFEFDTIDIEPRSLCGGLKISSASGLLNNTICMRNGYLDAFRTSITSETITVRNCLFYGGASRFSGWSSSFQIDNTNIEGITGSGHPSSSIKLRNCVLIGGAWGGYSWQAGTSNNASYDFATSPPPGSAGLGSSVLSADFVDDGINDYHLSSISQLIGQGFDLSADFLTDIDAENRSLPWDIGIDQYISAGGASVALDGISVSGASGSALLNVAVPIVSATSSFSSALGGLSSQLDLSGVSASISWVNGYINADLSFSASAISRSLADAGLQLNANPQGSGLSAASGMGALSATSGNTELLGLANADSLASVVLTLNTTLSGQAISKAMALANFVIGQTLSGSAQSISSGAAILVESVLLSAKAKSQATVSGGLDSEVAVSSSSVSASNATGGLMFSLALSADSLAEAFAHADLSVIDQPGVAGKGQSSSVGGGRLNISVPLSLHSLSRAIAKGALSTGFSNLPRIKRWTSFAEPRVLTVCA